MRVWIGCSGWQYKHWRGRFYPDDLPQKRWFDYYSRHFSTVEINNSFYRFPRMNNVRAWYAAAPPGFKFSVKVNRAITHMRLFHKTERMVRDFYAVADALGDKMGCLLFQMPERLTYKPEHLERILSQLDSRCPNVLEFRHESWKAVGAELRDRGVIVCGDLDSPTAYDRFHGAESYSKKELAAWANQLRAREAWAYFNNDANAYAVDNAKTLSAIVRETSRRPLRGPFLD